METLMIVNDLLADHSALDIRCLDRIYLNAYVPNLQVPGQVSMFMRDHLKMPVPSPSIMEKIGNKSRGAVKKNAGANGTPLVAIGVKRRLKNLPELIKKLTSINDRLTLA